ncbi:MAG: toxin-antitoxin system HicB family antitoxin [Dehalococcoidia bacterium]|nr:toxin-antitoxin system HicB family antitoxin [Dehalococcoidia bacterium]
MTQAEPDLRSRAEELAARPYRRVLIPDEDGVYFAEAPELPGAMTEGDSPLDALEMLDDAILAWILDALEDGKPVPEPSSDRDGPSGRFVARVPRTLHRRLAEAAEAEGVSLNALCNAYLAEGPARRDVLRIAEKRIDYALRERPTA